MGKKSSPTYDVRVIQLEKSSSDNALISFLTAQKEDSYLCLGHFDMLSIRKIDAGRLPLDAIQKDVGQEKESTSYAYPLYILKQIDATDDEGNDAASIQTELNDFWAKESNFLLVSRFHCDQVPGDPTPFWKQLMMRAKAMPAKGGLSHWSLCQKTRSYIRYLGHKNGDEPGEEATECEIASVVFYDSLELGDIVGIVKCNSLASSLQILQCLCGCKVVSDAYTYCGVNCDLLKNDGFTPLSRERKDALENRSLTYATTRFTVKLAMKAESLLRDLDIPAERVGFVTGTADLVVNWVPCTEGELVGAIGAVARSQNLYAAFSDIVTRIGIAYVAPNDSRGDKDGIVKKIPPECLPEIKDLSSYFCGQLERWRYPVSRMVSTLRAMYESSVMDALSMLLIPGVNAFLSRIKYIQENRAWKDTYEEDISDFLDWWSALVNDISHLESQIVQHPELTPARYYIPAMVLQFERTFLEDYVRIMERMDKKASKETPAAKPRAFVPILFPTPEENVYTLCPLDPEFDTQYTEDSPLCIFLPVRRIYQPWALAHMLGHEIQHYSGDNLRCRDLRMECLAKSAAAYVTLVLSSYVVENYQYRPDTIDRELQFQKAIAERILMELKSQTAPLYLRKIREMLPSAMFDAALRIENQETLQNILFEGEGLSRQMMNIRRLCQLKSIDMGVWLTEAFERHTQYLCHLYKECYADVSMILMLNCSFEDYYSCIFKDEALNDIYRTDAPQCEWTLSNQLQEKHTDRLALVILAMESRYEDWGLAAAICGSLWGTEAWKKAKHWQSVRDNEKSRNYRWLRLFTKKGIHSNALLADEAGELERYLCECVKQMSVNLEAEIAEVQSLRDHLAHVSDAAFNWNELRKYLGAI